MSVIAILCIHPVRVASFLSSHSGIKDLAVGASGDGDAKSGNGVARGAVYILFLHRNGTVKTESKISDSQGGLSASLADGDYFGVSVSSIGDLDLE